MLHPAAPAALLHPCRAPCRWVLHHNKPVCRQKRQARCGHGGRRVTHFVPQGVDFGTICALDLVSPHLLSQRGGIQEPEGEAPGGSGHETSVSYTHLTLPTNREV